jgi:transketolase
VKELTFVPQDEFTRVWTASDVPAPKRASLFADMARVNTLYMIMRAGSGHIGSSFSSLDIVTWIYLDRLAALSGSAELSGTYFSSKGHDAPGMYAVLTATGRLDFDLIHRLRAIDGLPGHPDVNTPFVEANTGSLGMGISKAKGMAEADRLHGVVRPIYVLTGDGELQEGQNWEALQGAVNRRLGAITLIVDHNKIQSDTWVARVSDLGDLAAKFAAFGWTVRRVDGHDIAALDDAMRELDGDPDVPGVVIADTVKGKGVSFMEDFPADGDLYPFHSGAPDAATYDKAVGQLLERLDTEVAAAGLSALQRNTVPLQPRLPAEGGRLVNAYSAALCDLADERPELVVLDGDLVLDTGLVPFAARFPDRFIECGIAEQDMVSQAGGLALRGALPVVHSFASFLSGRPHEQVLVNSTEGRRIVYVGSLAGVIPGGPGHSHQAVTDVASFAMVHDLVVIEPGHPDEVRPLLTWAFDDNPGSTYLRLTSPPVAAPPISWPLIDPVVGRGTWLRRGEHLTLVAAGPVMVGQCWSAAEKLAEEQVHVGVVAMPWLNRLDEAWWVDDVLASAPALVTAENHVARGGMGQFLLAQTALSAWRGRTGQVAVTGIPRCGSNDAVLQAHGLDAAAIVDAVRRTASAS